MNRRNFPERVNERRKGAMSRLDLRMDEVRAIGTDEAKDQLKQMEKEKEILEDRITFSARDRKDKKFRGQLWRK